MNKKKITILLLISIFMLPYQSFAEQVKLEFNGDNFSATLSKVPLKQIIAVISKEKKIQFQCKDELLLTKISVKFKNLQTTEGIKRILHKMNYSLIFNKDKQLQSVTIKEMGNALSPQNVIPPLVPSNNEDAFKVVPNRPPHNGHIKMDMNDLKEFKIKKNCPPHTGPLDKRLLNSDQFKVIKNHSPDSK